MNLKYTTTTIVRPLGVWAGALVMALLTAGCAASLQTGSSPGAVNAANTASTASTAGVDAASPQISVPPTAVGTWYDLGAERLSWLGGEGAVPVSGTNASTRAVGLQREDGRWLAVVVAQRAPVGSVAACPQHDSMHVGQGSPSDCLRMRRDADLDRWLQTQHAALWQWTQERGFDSRPRAWVGHRVSSGGQLFEVHVLLDPALIEPVTRNNSDFLAGGQPGQQWARALAAAARAAAGGAPLAVPPFPFAPGMASPKTPEIAEPVVTSPAPPTQATQVPQRQAPLAPSAPRRDRE
ncbi:hypothetical protein [Ottowia caeni]|uniref:hypothetical protein n=1 Tax=Ottowia caeni TaxID=2870339 RepID=UPI003D735CCB